ncbi:Endonuclease/exonuclease/phosphatase [Trinorchestia longiramus]|nr:Endonuclease/exonuclease/phosphatase [Trinorchestia longiramus]
MEGRKTMGPLVQDKNMKKNTILERVGQKLIRFPMIVMGDMNGHVAIRDEKVNENGCKLINFSERYEFKNLNVTILNGVHTWKGKEWKPAIDLMLMNHEAKRHEREMYVDENEFDVDTDNQILVLKYKWGRKEVMQKMSSVTESGI